MVRVMQKKRRMEGSSSKGLNGEKVQRRKKGSRGTKGKRRMVERARQEEYIGNGEGMDG
jgi:hypothetical protein